MSEEKGGSESCQAGLKGRRDRTGIQIQIQTSMSATATLPQVADRCVRDQHTSRINNAGGHGGGHLYISYRIGYYFERVSSGLPALLSTVLTASGLSSCVAPVSHCVSS